MDQNEKVNNYTCKICGRNYATLLGIVQHLRRGHNLSSEEYYLKYISSEIGKCEICGDKTKFADLNIGYKRACSMKCGSLLGARINGDIILNLSLEDALKRNENISNQYHLKSKKEKQKIKDKRAKTNLERYGNEIPSKLESVRAQISETKQNHTPERKKEIQEKRIETTMDRYGVDHVFKTNQFVEKSKQTNLERYGVENYTQSPDYIVKSKQTKLKKYGDACYNNRTKSRETCLERYGVEHHNQNPEIFYKAQKTAYTSKEYGLPSGKKIFLQGFEPFAMDILLELYDENDLRTGKKDVPKIWYKYEGKKHIYYPDILIKSENRLIEVKSTYTMSVDEFEIIKKCEAAAKLGYDIEVWVIDKDGSIVNKILY